MTQHLGATPLTWRKSSYSGGEQGQCIEVAETTTAICIRDSKVPDGPVMTVGAAPFSAFVAYARTLEA